MSAFHMKDRLLKLVKPRQKTTPNMTLGYPLLNTYLWHHFFDAMAAVKKLANFMSALNYPSSTNEAS